MKQTTALAPRTVQKQKAAADAEEKRQKRLAAALARQHKLKAEGLCLRCSVRKANRGAGSTANNCPACAEKGRIYSRRRYRAKLGLRHDAPVKATGRPLNKPFKA